MDETDESSEVSTDIEMEDDDSVYGDSKSKRKKSETSVQRKLILEPCVDAVNFEKKFRDCCYIEDKLSFLFNDSKRSWSKCEAPPTRISRSVGISVNDLQTDKSSKNILHLDTLKGSFENKSHVMFCGGSVNCLAWCNSINTGDQILAVATKDSFQASKLSDTATGQSVIQFWSVPLASPPSFQFGLRHSLGNVWCLEWCPSSRGSCLGYLAAGCSDGTVRVWRVPDMASLEPGMVYSGAADLSLLPGDPDVGQCVAVSWYRGPGHEYLAASFVSGMVAVWHLTTRSPLLRQETSVVLPVQTWLAHHGNAGGVSLCPGREPEPRYLVTGGSDRCYRFWDLRDTSVPLQEQKKGLVSDVAWVSSWTGAGVSYDDVYLQSHTQSLLAEAGYHGTRSQPVISQNSCVTSLAMSQWLASMAVVTSAGELIIFVMPTLDKSLEHDKNLAQRRCYVYRTEMVTDPAAPDLREYSDASHHCNLVYHDSGIHLANKFTCPSDEVRRVRSSDGFSMAAEDLTKYPMAGLTSVSWNNNPGYHNMLASAGHAGIVRVHSIAALNTPSIKQVFPAN